MDVETTVVPKKSSFFNDIKEKILLTLRLSDDPTVKLYNGYGNNDNCVVFGHVFSFGPVARKKYRKHFITNTLAVLRLFMVRPVKGAQLRFTWEGQTQTTKSASDGFFRFEWKPSIALDPGWHPVEVEWLRNGSDHVITKGKAYVSIPYHNQFAFISDIDDTFLISHSSNLRKRLMVLLTENARSRKPFEGVVNHYQLLSMAGAPDKTTNPFFFVSSSEWNLYDYISEFSELNKLPKGVYLLNQLKLFSQVIKTGQNNHKTKFMRISRIMEAYPGQKVVLLGDDSQEDPVIYAAIASHFKNQVHAVYIRKTVKNPKVNVEERIKEMEANGVLCSYFSHSSEAVIHSKQIGLIKSEM
ncbi:MAG: phosphatase domain-containing protein [Ferruginibacter sp.]